MKSMMEFLLLFLLVLLTENVVFGQSYASVPFTDNFSGTGSTLGSNWSTSFTNATRGRIERRALIGSWPKFNVPSADGNTLGSNYDASYGEPSGGGMAIYNTSGSLISPNNYLSASLAVNLQNALAASATFQIVDWGTGYGESNDQLNVYLSTNGGASFGATPSVVPLYLVPYDDGRWNNVTIDIGALANDNNLTLSSTTIVKFTFNLKGKGNTSAPKEGSQFIYMDNFSMSASFTLPVELINFSASKIKETSFLSWQTASEINNDYFIVQRSSDGIHFDDLLKVKGNGNSTSLKDYVAYDENPINGINYYRLKQVDYDGKTEYSSVISIDFEKDENKFLVFPNPSSGLITVATQMENDGKIAIYDAIGKMVFYQDIKDNVPNSISLEHLANGNYFIQLINNNNVSTKKITLIH